MSSKFYKFPGPGFWGLINPQWSMCNKGRRQSPVNVEPEKLLFDPWLRDIQFDKHKVTKYLFLIIIYHLLGLAFIIRRWWKVARTKRNSKDFINSKHFWQSFEKYMEGIIILFRYSAFFNPKLNIDFLHYKVF